MRGGYFMEDEREAPRLAEKVDAAAWVDRFLAHRLLPGMQILDAGCGPGTIAAAVAHAEPGARIVALDASPARVAAARAALATSSNAQVVTGDVRCLPFPDATFDLVYCRFLLEYVPDKARAVAELARVCRPDGTVLLHDLDGQLVDNYPPDDALERDLATILDRLAGTGFDPHVGRKLFHLAREARLEPEDVRVDAYHLIAGAVESNERRRWELKLDIAEAALRRSEMHIEGLKERFLAYLDRPDTITFSQLFTVTARKPGQ